MKDSGEGRDSESTAKTPGEQGIWEILLESRARDCLYCLDRSHRTWPGGFIITCIQWLLVICNSFLYKLEDFWVLLIFRYQFLALAFSVRDDGENSLTFLIPWWKFGADAKSCLQPEILELELKAVTRWGFWLSPLRRCMSLFLSVERQVQIDIWEGGRIWKSLTRFCPLLPGHISRLHFSACLTVESGHVTSLDPPKMSRKNENHFPFKAIN